MMLMFAAESALSNYDKEGDETISYTEFKLVGLKLKILSLVLSDAVILVSC